MANKNQYSVYWDSGVFLAYINQETGRVNTVENMWKEIVEDYKGAIITSTISIAEVAKASYEINKLDHRIDDLLDNLWRDPNILLVEASTNIMYDARRLMRSVISSGWSLRPPDAIHLATAKYIEKSGRIINEINTYDPAWAKYQTVIGIPIQEPNHKPKYSQPSFLQ